jgi:hypothetical protein
MNATQTATGLETGLTVLDTARPLPVRRCDGRLDPADDAVLHLRRYAQRNAAAHYQAGPATHRAHQAFAS